MVGKALLMSMLLLANKDGNVSAQLGTMQTDTKVEIYQEQQEEYTGFGAYEDGDYGHVNTQSGTLGTQTTPKAIQKTGQAADTSYPKKSYTFDKDGSWVCGDYHYLYRFELIGRNAGATEDGRFLVLTNDAKMSFERVSKSFTSDNPADRLDLKNTVVVEAGWYR